MEERIKVRMSERKNEILVQLKIVVSKIKKYGMMEGEDGSEPPIMHVDTIEEYNILCIRLKEEEKLAVARVKKFVNIDKDEVLMSKTKEEFMESQLMITMKTVNPFPEQLELLHAKKSTMRVGTRKHEGHDYFVNKLFSDTKKQIDDKFRQRIKGMTKIAATARYVGREEAEKQACLEIEEVQAEWMTLGRLRPYSTKETFQKALAKLKSQAQRPSTQETLTTPTPSPEDVE